MQTLSDLYKDISDLDKKNSLLKNYYMLPGFNIIEANNSSNANSSNANTSNVNNILTKDNPVIADKLFMQFFSFFNATHNNLTQRSKHKLSKKSEKKFTQKLKRKSKTLS
jgi:hypothetical protein